MKFFTLVTMLLILSSCQNQVSKTESIVAPNTNQINIQPKPNETFKQRSRNLTEISILANEQAIRLKPSDFKELPEEIIKELEKRKCTIPQIWHSKTPHNVISGEYSKKGQKDWAVLCSINRISSILIFWNGSTKNAAEIGKSEDLGYFQTVDSNNEMGFSRAIATVDKKYIIDHYNSYGGVKPPQIDHEGINDAFVEKASGVLYFHRGKWLELQGAD
ncbi:MAG TPA: hypothetical protein VK308_15920 [Pyrinomonadaceae bacterium]|nr:hypothetical protein [Pyrinomonadaceae bacterium]